VEVSRHGIGHPLNTTITHINRDFLLFIPATAPNLEAVLSYFSAAVRLSPEGDVVLSDESIEGMGKKTLPLFKRLKPFFRVIVDIAQPPPRFLYDYYGASDIDDPEYFQYPEDMSQLASVPDLDLDELEVLAAADLTKWKNLKPVLIACVPNPGYFVAGGLAGAVSRTATAPLDRLKVYLIAQTGTAKQSLGAAKSGAARQALKGAWRTSANAMKELWAAGGLRSLYAGKCPLHQLMRW
jgi:solute carrier family 25 (mitochondrial phosphate transporter), member 23/24/25/41